MMKYVAVLFGCLIINLVSAQEPQASSEKIEQINPNIVQALMQMKMSTEQADAFAAQMQAFAGRVHSMVNRTLRRNSPGSNKEREIKKKLRGLMRKLDEPIAVILREDQWEAYLGYKQLISDEMRSRNYQQTGVDFDPSLLPSDGH